MTTTALVLHRSMFELLSLCAVICVGKAVKHKLGRMFQAHDRVHRGSRGILHQNSIRWLSYGTPAARGGIGGGVSRGRRL